MPSGQIVDLGVGAMCGDIIDFFESNKNIFDNEGVKNFFLELVGTRKPSRYLMYDIDLAIELCPALEWLDDEAGFKSRIEIFIAHPWPPDDLDFC